MHLDYIDVSSSVYRTLSFAAFLEIVNENWKVAPFTEAYSIQD